MIPAIVIALILAGAIVGGATVLGAPVFAIPVIVVLLAVWGAATVGRRILGRAPRDQPIRFSAEDRATLVPSPSPAERAANRRRSAQDARR
jgi:hypothetical protein